MPITRKHFELGINSDIEAWMKKLHSYLAEHKDQAFTLEELLQAFDLTGHFVVPERPGESERARVVRSNRDSQLAQAALKKLIELDVVLEREIKGTTYYSLGERPLPV